jgi:hypothetical protein
MLSKYLNVVIAICFISISSIAQTQNIKTKDLENSPVIAQNGRGELLKFREVKFGASQKEIKKTEKSKLLHTLDEGTKCTLIYQTKVAGLDCEVFYTLVNDKLLMAAYFFSEEHVNKNLFIDDYNKVLSNLKEKYGEPDDGEKNWSNNLYKNDSSEWGLAISIGHLTYSDIWNFANGDITTVLKGDNFKISHFVRYTMNDYNKKLEDTRKTSNEF